MTTTFSINFCTQVGKEKIKTFGFAVVVIVIVVMSFEKQEDLIGFSGRNEKTITSVSMKCG